MRGVLLDYPDRHRYGQGSAWRGGDHMSQNPQRPKLKIEPKLESTIVIRQPTVRNFSTGGGHLPGDVIIEGDQKIVTKKWQGYPPESLKVVGKRLPPMPEIATPRFLGKAGYAELVGRPSLPHVEPVPDPHPRPRLQA